MSLNPPASLRALSDRSGTDWLWGSLGVCFAISSAAFAAYMIVIGPSQRDLSGGGEFGVFAHFDQRARVAGQPGPSKQAIAAAIADRAGAEAGTAAPDAQGLIDYAPTGAIDKSHAEQGVRQPNSPLADAVRAGRATTLADFVLRDVFDGKALVEGRNRLALVHPGSVLEGAGEVLSIERQRDAWVVVTRSGVIGSRPR